jgi:replication factor C small subunit
MITNKLFVEKYRPQTFEDYIGNDTTVIAGLRKVVRENPFSLPNLIFESSAGTGKTTLAKIIINELGADKLYLNASDERGIDTVREKVKAFASTVSFKSDVPKIVHLDEADGLTADAQNILRNIMEEYSSRCRFILTCNTISKIIEPLRSRCKVISFGKPARNESYTLKLLSEEDMTIDDVSLNEIIDVNYPDIRSMVKALDIYKNLGELDTKKNINVADELYTLIQGRKITEARKLWNSNTVDYRNIVFQIYLKVWNDTTLSASDKITVIEIIAETDYRMVYGANAEITFANMAFKLMKILGKKGA